jgi:hypothetical protein
MLHIPAERRNEGIPASLAQREVRQSCNKFELLETLPTIAQLFLASLPTIFLVILSSVRLVKIPWATALYFPYLWFIHQGGREVRECHCLKWARDTRGMAHRLESARRLAMATFSRTFSYNGIFGPVC